MRQANYYDVLKVVALVTMTIDHIAFFFMPEQDWLRVIGRIAAPSFLFLVGYNGSYRFRYGLLIAAIATSGIDVLALGLRYDAWMPQNILWTILITRAVLHYSLPRFAPRDIAIVAAVLMPVTILLFDFGSLGVLFALAGSQLRNAQVRAAGYMLAAGVTLYFLWSVTHIFARADGAHMAVLAMLLGAMGWWMWRANHLAPVRVMPRLIGGFSAAALTYYVAHRVVMEIVLRLL